jgi:hypothetical protein
LDEQAYGHGSERIDPNAQERGNMSIFDEEETQCHRENNSCKRRNKCRRFLVQPDNKWIAGYWDEFNKFCEHFRIMPKEEIVVKTGAEIEKDKG